MDYTIDRFWLSRFGTIKPSSALTVAGWNGAVAESSSFVEAALALREGYDNLGSPVWLVAAPGAVGKSTLAKQIAARTGAVYLDLSAADTVAGNYLTGGLVKNRLMSAWEAGETTLLVDALDEARLRVTQKSFEDFLSDLREVAGTRSVPLVVFGRVGIVEEAWLLLDDLKMNCPIFDISFFDQNRAKAFVFSTLRRFAGKSGNEALATSLRTHEAGYRSACERFVQGLNQTAGPDGARFAGYAPVLEAVGTVLSGITNPATLNEAVQEAMQGKILQHLTSQILSREAVKLRDQLTGFDEGVKNRLYGPNEQLVRLAAKLYGSATPTAPAGLAPELLAQYDKAVSSFLPQHPFLDGTGAGPSGAVFAAVINAHALTSDSLSIRDEAQRRAGNGPHTPNPFLIDFYLAAAERAWGDGAVVPPELVVSLYESVRARASSADVVRLSVEGEEGAEDLDVEIQVLTAGDVRPHRILLRSSQAGTLRFGRQVNGVSVDAPSLDVIIGSGYPVEMIAPVSLSVARLEFACGELVVQAADRASGTEDQSVLIEAVGPVSSVIGSAPIVRKGVEFKVSWPGAAVYPWSSFATDALGASDEDLSESLRIFRRLVMAFRSHSKGRLARFRDKIEHARMTKGKTGLAIRTKLLDDGVLSLEGEMYFLEPNLLGQRVGSGFQDIKLRRFSPGVRRYLREIMSFSA